MDELSEEQFGAAVATWRERMRAHAGASYVQLIVNEGGGAGASLEHSHAQLYALDFVPAAVARERERVGAYAERTAGGGLLSEILVEEVRRKDRLVAIDDEAALICPWASRSPFELRVVPRRRPASFAEDDGGAAMIHTALRLLAERFDGSPSSTSGSAPRRAAPSTSTGTSTSRRGSASRPPSSSPPASTSTPTLPSAPPPTCASASDATQPRAHPPLHRRLDPGGDPARALRRAARRGLPQGLRGDRGPAGRRRAARPSSTGTPSAPGAAGSGSPARPAPRVPRERWSSSATSPTSSPSRASPPSSAPPPTSPTSSPRTTRAGKSTSTTR